MRKLHVRFVALVCGLAPVLTPAFSQQSHWASADDPAAKYIIEMERKWAEDVCANNGVVGAIVADDFQGTAPNGTRFTKADQSQGSIRDQTGRFVA
jgi:hypothetical protein